MGALIVCRHFASDQVGGTTIVTCQFPFQIFLDKRLIMTMKKAKKNKNYQRRFKNQTQSKWIRLTNHQVTKWNIEKDLSKMCSALSCGVKSQRSIPEDHLQAFVSICFVSFQFVLIHLKKHCRRISAGNGVNMNQIERHEHSQQWWFERRWHNSL